MADQSEPTFFILPRQTKMPRTHARRSLLLGSALTLGMGIVVAGACGGSMNGNADPCESTYANQCGGACKSDGDCPAVVHCGVSGVCTADYGNSGDGARQCPEGQAP